jgi:hypothetical protein
MTLIEKAKRVFVLTFLKLVANYLTSQALAIELRTIGTVEEVAFTCRALRVWIFIT